MKSSPRVWKRSGLSAFFPDWNTDAATVRWASAKDQLAIGQQVQGLVVARAPFGVWVDIGIGFPALLLVPEMLAPRGDPIHFTDYAPKGSTVYASIASLGPDAKIGLTQRS